MNRLSRSIFRLETKLNVSIQTFKRQLGNNPLFENVQTPTQWIHTMMTKKRKVVIQPPKFLSLQPIQLPLFNFSELAGHGYFIFLALSYLESDLLNLRLFAFSGLTLSIIFQYYRDAPLWLSIRWNTLFVIINSVMIGLLIKKRSDAANMTEDQKLLHEKYFKNKGMSQIDFFHLISMAKRVEVPKGTTLIKMGQLNSKVYLVQKGELSVYKGDRKIGTIQKHQFAGEMSYLRWQTKKHKKEAMQIAAAAQSADDPSAEVAPDSSSIATTSITSLPNNEQREKEEPLLSSGPRGLASKLLGLSVSFSAEPNAEASSRDLVQSSPGMKEEEDGQEGQADVVCEEDGCVVYCWRFKDIYELISFNPLLGLVIERSFSEDLNHKMIHSRQEELLLRYKILVGHAVHRYHFDRSHHRVLASRSASTEEAASQSSAMTNNIHLRDHVYPKDFADLQKFCIINDISDFQQEHILQEVLVEEEKRSRDRVTEKIEGTALTQQYRELLKLELERPRGVSIHFVCNFSFTYDYLTSCQFKDFGGSKTFFAGLSTYTFHH